VCARGCPDLHYVDFWREFPADESASIRTMFRALFGGLGLRKPVAIRSVFAHHHRATPSEPWPPRSDRERYVRVGFSGEPEFLDPGDFDLNLVMAPDDAPTNVVSFLSFAAYAHEFGLWPSFAGRAGRRAGEQFCVAVVSNPRGAERQRFLSRLHQRRGIDSCGRWMNTTGFLAPRDETAFGDRWLPFLGRYRFMVCFENTARSYYLTEKLANAYVAGCVPVYWGAPEALGWLNPEAFLWLAGTSDGEMDALIERVLALDSDPAAYQRLRAAPLLVGPVPPLMRLPVMREKIEATLRRSRPDAF
jgi:hypothetical protein